MNGDGQSFTFPSGTFQPWLGAGYGGGQTAAWSPDAPEGPFELDEDSDGYTIRHCKLQFGRQELSCDDTKLDIRPSDDSNDSEDYVVYAKVTHASSSSVSLSVGHTKGRLPTSTLARTYRRLYDISKTGSITDYRTMPTLLVFN